MNIFFRIRLIKLIIFYKKKNKKTTYFADSCVQCRISFSATSHDNQTLFCSLDLPIKIPHTSANKKWNYENDIIP